MVAGCRMAVDEDCVGHVIRCGDLNGAILCTSCTLLWDALACTCSGGETGCAHAYWCPQAKAEEVR